MRDGAGRTRFIFRRSGGFCEKENLRFSIGHLPDIKRVRRGFVTPGVNSGKGEKPALSESRRNPRDFFHVLQILRYRQFISFANPVQGCRKPHPCVNRICRNKAISHTSGGSCVAASKQFPHKKQVLRLTYLLYYRNTHIIYYYVLNAAAPVITALPVQVPLHERFLHTHKSAQGSSL